MHASYQSLAVNNHKRNIEGWLINITDSPCDQITITVSGYNGLNGEDESISGVRYNAICLLFVFQALSLSNSFLFTKWISSSSAQC